MSATLQQGKYSGYFGGCPITTIGARTFPVQVRSSAFLAECWPTPPVVACERQPSSLFLFVMVVTGVAYSPVGCAGQELFVLRRFSSLLVGVCSGGCHDCAIHPCICVVFAALSALLSIRRTKYITGCRRFVWRMECGRRTGGRSYTHKLVYVHFFRSLTSMLLRSWRCVKR